MTSREKRKIARSNGAKAADTKSPDGLHDSKCLGSVAKMDNYLRAMFHRIKARPLWPKAIIAVAHKIIVIAYSMLTTKHPYQKLGGDYFD